MGDVLKFFENLGHEVEKGVETVYHSVEGGISTLYTDIKGVSPQLFNAAKDLEKDIKSSYDMSVNKIGDTVDHLGDDGAKTFQSLSLPLIIGGLAVIVLVLNK